MRIRSILLLLTGVVLAPGFLAAAVAIEKVRDAQRESALRGLTETVRATALLVDGQLQRSIGALTALGNSPSIQTANDRAFYQEAAALDAPPDVWTMLLDKSGKQRINTRVPFGTQLPPPVAQERVAKALATQRPVVSDLIVGPVSKKLLTTVYVPAKADPFGQFVVAQAFSVDHWKKTALQPQGRDRWIVGVIDHQGRFISRSHGSDQMLGRQARPELVAAAAASHDGLIRHATLEGVDSYDAFTHSDLTGWTIAIAAPVTSIENSATQAVRWLLAGGVTAPAFAVIGALGLSRTLIGSMAQAARSAKALGRGIQLADRPTAVREVNDLIDALKGAAIQLETERVARKRVEGEREALLDNERVNRAAAEAENLAKDRFIALLGHELRNPLAAISNATEVFVRRGHSDSQEARLHDILARQSRHLKRIIDDLLEVSRMLSGKIVLELVPVDLAALLRTYVDTFKMTPEVREMQISLNLDDATVLADPVRIEQIITNLFGNAAKFSSPNGAIRVGLARHGSKVVLEVSDDGEGISHDLLPHVFEPFVQGVSSGSTQQSGLGIGLALVRQLVELHGGTVEAYSAGPGHGATFVVTLPSMNAPPDLTSSHNRSSDLNRPTQGRILLVEDNEDARESTGLLLRALGYDVTTAENGEEGLQIALDQLPDVIVSDLAMPTMTGYELARAVRKSHPICHLPMIALSGYGDEKDRQASHAAGFDVHLVKPVDAVELVETIEKLRLGDTANDR